MEHRRKPTRRRTRRLAGVPLDVSLCSQHARRPTTHRLHLRTAHPPAPRPLPLTRPPPRLSPPPPTPPPQSCQRRRTPTSSLMAPARSPRPARRSRRSREAACTTCYSPTAASSASPTPRLPMACHPDPLPPSATPATRSSSTWMSSPSAPPSTRTALHSSGYSRRRSSLRSPGRTSGCPRTSSSSVHQTGQLLYKTIYHTLLNHSLI